MSVGSSPISRQLVLFMFDCLFLSIDRGLCLIPIIGMVFVTCLPKNLDLVNLGELKKPLLISSDRVIANLTGLEFKFFNFILILPSANGFFFLNNFVFFFFYKLPFFFERLVWFLQQKYYSFFFHLFRIGGSPSFYTFLDQKCGVFFSGITFAYSCLMYLFRSAVPLSSGLYFQTNFFGLCYLGVDSISLLFIILSTFLIFVCILIHYSTNIERSTPNFSKVFLLSFLSLDVFLILVFSVLDFFFFYIFFELILIPMMLIIGFFGSRSRKIWAMYYFVIYTIVGSLSLLVGIFVYFNSIVGFIGGLLPFLDNGVISPLQFELIKQVYLYTPFLLFDQLPLAEQYFIWMLLFVGFAIKVPIIPFHLWLPEAHVEAPTAGSMLLAGILLKLGGYGFIRFLLPLSMNIFYLTVPLVYTLSIVSIFYGALTTLRQIDVKRIIAYSSIVHMNVAVLGMFSNNADGIIGGIVLMLAHGIVSVGLFYVIGILYERFGSRLIEYYGGLVLLMPQFSFFFFLFILGNTSFPGTLNFVGELLNFLGVGTYSIFGLFIGLFFSMFLGTIYSFWLYNRLIFGQLKHTYLVLNQNFLSTRQRDSFDLSSVEFFVVGLLAILMVVFGVYPEPILNFLSADVVYYIY